MKATCNRCHEEFDAESITWARHKGTGKDAQGCAGKDDNGKPQFYGSNVNQIWAEDEYEEFEQQVGGVGTFGMCEDCCERKWKAEEANPYRSKLAPAWFDPADAGEVWGEDEY